LWLGETGRPTHGAPFNLATIISVIALMKQIHAGGDNYSDQPKPLGGGGARIACGTL
jgi:Cu-Zn family superoxide dismutase